MPISLLELSFRVLGAVCGAMLAIAFARHMHAGSTGVGAVEAALIALLITASREIAGSLFEFAKYRRERTRLTTLLAHTRAELEQVTLSDRPIPFAALAEVTSALWLRERVRVHDFAALELMLTGIRQYATRYSDLLLTDARQLADQLLAIAEKLTGATR
jgi:hypothetical protein